MTTAISTEVENSSEEKELSASLQECLSLLDSNPEYFRSAASYVESLPTNIANGPEDLASYLAIRDIVGALLQTPTTRNEMVYGRVFEEMQKFINTGTGEYPYISKQLDLDGFRNLQARAGLQREGSLPVYLDGLLAVKVKDYYFPGLDDPFVHDLETSSSKLFENLRDKTAEEIEVLLNTFINFYKQSSLSFLDAMLLEDQERSEVEIYEDFYNRLEFVRLTLASTIDLLTEGTQIDQNKLGYLRARLFLPLENEKIVDTSPQTVTIGIYGDQSQRRTDIRADENKVNMFDHYLRTKHRIEDLPEHVSKQIFDDSYSVLANQIIFGQLLELVEEQIFQSKSRNLTTEEVLQIGDSLTAFGLNNLISINAYYPIAALCARLRIPALQDMCSFWMYEHQRMDEYIINRANNIALAASLQNYLAHVMPRSYKKIVNCTAIQYGDTVITQAMYRYLGLDTGRERLVENLPRYNEFIKAVYKELLENFDDLELDQEDPIADFLEKLYQMGGKLKGGYRSMEESLQMRIYEMEDRLNEEFSDLQDNLLQLYPRTKTSNYLMEMGESGMKRPETIIREKKDKNSLVMISANPPHYGHYQVANLARFAGFNPVVSPAISIKHKGGEQASIKKRVGMLKDVFLMGAPFEVFDPRKIYDENKEHEVIEDFSEIIEDTLDEIKADTTVWGVDHLPVGDSERVRELRTELEVSKNIVFVLRPHELTGEVRHGLNALMNERGQGHIKILVAERTNFRSSDDRKLSEDVVARTFNNIISRPRY